MNKAESMGYGPARGANPAGEPLPKSNGGSFKESSEAATLVATANSASAQELNDRMATNLAIEARKVSPEVALLNDAAEIAIYGTRGQTAGYVDAAGKPISKPILGTIDRILTSPRYGNTPAERKKAEAAAKEYSDGVDQLLGEGFELCQAKLVMDKRSEWAYNNDQSAKSEVKEGNKYFRELDRRIDLITEQNIKNGDTPDVARQKAEERVRGHNVEMGKPSVPEVDAKAEESRIKGLIKKHGVFTADELEAVLTGKTPDVSLTPDEIAAREQAERSRVALTQRVQAARTEYARASAARGRRAIHTDEQLSSEHIQTLRETYEAVSLSLINHEARMAYVAGVSAEDLSNYSSYFAIGEAERIANVVQRERQLATGRYELSTTAGTADFDDRGNRRTQEAEATSKIGKLANKFYKWWGKQGADSKFLSVATLKKSAVLGGAGIVVGIPTALAGSVLLGPIAGGALGAVIAGRIAKSVMAYNVNKRGEDPMYIERLTGEVEGSVARLEHLTDIGDVIDSQTKNEVKRNRRRLGGAVVAAAAGGAVGSIGAEHLFGFGADNNGGGGHNTTTGHGSGATGTSDEQGATGTTGSTGATGASGPSGPTDPTGPTGSPNPGGPSADGAGHSGGHNGGHGGNGHEASTASANSLELKSGQNPWDVSAKFLQDSGYKHDTASIDKAKDAVLAHYNITEPGAENLPVGWKFQIPPDVLDEIGKE